MSILSQALKAEPTGTVFAAPKHVKLDAATKGEFNPVSLAMQYRMGVTIATTFSVVGEPGTDAFAFAQEEARKHLVHYVYGEFRDIIWDLRAALMNYEFLEAQAVLTDLERRLFEV